MVAMVMARDPSCRCPRRHRPWSQQQPLATKRLAATEGLMAMACRILRFESTLPSTLLTRPCRRPRHRPPAHPRQRPRPMPRPTLVLRASHRSSSSSNSKEGMLGTHRLRIPITMLHTILPLRCSPTMGNTTSSNTATMGTTRPKVVQGSRCRPLAQ